MRVFFLIAGLSIVFGCPGRAPRDGVDAGLVGEREGGEGEGDLVVGEGEGDLVVGEGEGDLVGGEGEGEGEGDLVGGEGEGEPEPPCEHVASLQPLIVDAAAALTALGERCQLRGFANRVSPGPTPFDEGAAALAELDANACHADIRFDDDAALACRQAYLDAADDCTQPIDDAPCRRLIVGSAGEGDACGSASVCDEGPAPLFCSARAGEGCGTCFAERPLIGDRCRPGFVPCELGSECIVDAAGVEGECVAHPAREPTGAVCTVSTTCAVGNLCRDGRCRRVVDIGGVCGADTTCVGDSVCDGAVCAARPAIGAVCGEVVPCARGGLCRNGLCETIRELDPCVDDDDCLPFLTCDLDRRCSPAPMSGRCLRGACAAGFTCTVSGCARDHSAGDACDEDHPCGADASCSAEEGVCLDQRVLGAHQFGGCPEGAEFDRFTGCTFDAATPPGTAVGDPCVKGGNACGPTLETGLGCDDSGHCAPAVVVADGERCDADNVFTGLRWCVEPSKCWTLPGASAPTCNPVAAAGDACDPFATARCPEQLRCELTGPGAIHGGDFRCQGPVPVGAGAPCPTGRECLIGLLCRDHVCTGPEDIPRPHADLCPIE